MPIITKAGEFKTKEHYIRFLEASIDAIIKTNKCTINVETSPGGDYIAECSHCKHKMMFIIGTPEENNYKYCCNCGAKIEKIEYQEEI